MYLYLLRLSDLELDQIAKMPYDTVLFTDFGSGKIDKIIEHKELGNFIPVICDHHQPSDILQINSEPINHRIADLDFHLNPPIWDRWGHRIIWCRNLLCPCKISRMQWC